MRVVQMTYDILDIRCPNPVTILYNSAIDTGGVRIPDFNHQIGKRLAGLDINELQFDSQGNPLLSLCYIFANVFTTNPVRSIGNFGCENT